MNTKRLGYLVWGVVALGCGGSTAKTSSQGSTGETSTVSGQLSIATFPTAPTKVTAVDESGASIAAQVDAEGRFQLALAKGHTYRFTVALASTSEPIVFPRASNHLDTTVRISAASATIGLGTVRHLDAAPSGGFKVKSSSSTPSNEQEDDGDGECENGKDATTGAVCVDDDDKHGCGEGSHEDHGGDGECENGKDAKTGAACTDDDEAENEAADPSQPMAVPEHNAPDDVADCKGDDGEKEDGEDEDDD